jgi:hypothetical protein
LSGFGCIVDFRYNKTPNNNQGVDGNILKINGCIQLIAKSSRRKWQQVLLSLIHKEGDNPLKHEQVEHSHS